MKNEKIIDLAAKEEWGKFALELHHMAKEIPGLVAKWEMFGFVENGFSRGGRCTVKMTMPDLDWVMHQPAEGIFKNFPNKSNGKKIILPLYLKLVLERSRSKADVDIRERQDEEYDYFVLVANDRSVQVLIYGQDCIFPFCVTTR